MTPALHSPDASSHHAPHTPHTPPPPAGDQAGAPRRQRPVPAGLPAALAPLHRRVAALVEGLPSTPPSAWAARVLDRLLLPRLPADARAALLHQVVALHVEDFGLRVHLRLGTQGFEPAGDGPPPVLRIRAPASGFVRLARGDEDPDRLFFERQLLMEGDTELGLVLKNTLDAIGPLFTPPRFLRARPLRTGGRP